MKCNMNTLKAYARKWHKALDAAYEMEFDRAASCGYYMATPNERMISTVKGLLDRAMSDDSRIYMATDIDGKYTGEMVICEVPALYELGNDFSMNEVQNVLRGLNCIAHELVYTCICLDLNSATIRDFGKLVDFITAKVEREAAEQEAAANAAEQEQEAPAETETEQATTEAAPTTAAELDSLKAIRDDITTDPNPDTIRAAQDAINRHFVEIDPEDIDTPRKIRAALTDIINAIYWDIAEDITPATTATEIPAPLQLETLSARLDRMTAAELVNLYAATSAPGSIDDETDSAIYDALRASNPRAYRVWMKYSIEYIPGDPASIEAANAADVEHLRAAYGITA